MSSPLWFLIRPVHGKLLCSWGGITNRDLSIQHLLLGRFQPASAFGSCSPACSCSLIHALLAPTPALALALAAASNRGRACAVAPGLVDDTRRDLLEQPHGAG